MQTDNHSEEPLIASFSHSAIQAGIHAGRGCHVYAGLLIRIDLGFSFLLKDTSTCSQGKQGITPAPSRLPDSPHYLLSHSCTKLSRSTFPSPGTQLNVRTVEHDLRVIHFQIPPNIQANACLVLPSGKT